MENTIKVRIKFKKYGAIKFIGHLDVMRYFQKAIRRAEIDVAYTAGFSPHQIMTFAAPLGVGLESNGEYMDIEVFSMSSCQDIMDKLNAVNVKGIEIIHVSVLPERAGNAMASVAAASYTVRFKNDFVPDFDITEKLPVFLSSDTITYTKSTKKGTREMDLRPGIYSLNWNGNSFSMLLDASSSGNIKPGQVLEAFFSSQGLCLPENVLAITREEVFTNTASEGESPNFIPLSEIGIVK